MNSHNLQTFVLDIFKQTKEEDLNYIYRGFFTRNITDSILELTEKNLEDVKDSTKIKKRVYFIMVESLQNVTRYQTVGQGSLKNTAVFFIQKKGPYYLITTGNLIDNNKIDYVRSQLKIVNSLNKDELKNYYKKILKNGKFTNEGGAGLGLIEMARKSGNKLSFSFSKLNEEFSYFYLHTILPSLSEEDENNYNYQKTLDKVIEYHYYMNKYNILLAFNSQFSQESLLNLMNIVDRQIIDLSSQRKRFFNIMIEMVQNVIHHGKENIDEEAKSGIFFVIDKDSNFSLNTGNYIEVNKIKPLKDKLDKINKLTNKQLDDFYNKKLFDFKNTTAKKAGLGIIDIRIKSEHKLSYCFTPINDKYSFFTLEINIEKYKDAKPVNEQK